MASNKVGARRNGKFRAVCTAPSFNKTPIGPSTPPVPYPVCQDLSNSVGTIPTVNFNGDPVYVLDQSTQPMCIGDAAGSVGGVKSGTVGGEVKPSKGSTTVKATKKPVVRENDPCTLNGGNCPGLYLTQPAPSGSITNGKPSSSSGPPVVAETAKEAQAAKEEKGFLGKLWDKAKDIGQQIWNHPGDAAIGFGKDILNIPSNLAELLAKGSTLQQAADMQESAAMMELIGQHDHAEAMWQDAEAVRSSANEIDVPKFRMNNPAQQAGATVSTVVQLAWAAYGLFGLGRGLLGAARATAAEGEVLSSAAKGGQALQEGEAIANAEKAAAEGEKAAAAANEAPKGGGAAEKPGTGEAPKTPEGEGGSGVRVAKPPPPQKVTDVLKYVRENGKAPSGYKGGRTFENDGRGLGQKLPEMDANGNPIKYQEWDVNPYTKGVNRGAERLVTGSDGSAYLTGDHYNTFSPIE